MKGPLASLEGLPCNSTLLLLLLARGLLKKQNGHREIAVTKISRNRQGRSDDGLGSQWRPSHGPPSREIETRAPPPESTSSGGFRRGVRAFLWAERAAVTGVAPSPTLVRAFIFTAVKLQHSHCSSSRIELCHCSLSHFRQRRKTRKKVPFMIKVHQPRLEARRNRQRG